MVEIPVCIRNGNRVLITRPSVLKEHGRVGRPGKAEGEGIRWRPSIRSAVEKSQYSAPLHYAEFDSSGNSISASCRKPQVICARSPPPPSLHLSVFISLHLCPSPSLSFLCLLRVYLPRLFRAPFDPPPANPLFVYIYVYTRPST